MAGEGHPADHPLERLIFFSDAVFAIAITLLVIEIHVPTPADARAAGGYDHALIELLPNFMAFLISFAVIARFWTGHHQAFSLRARFDRGLLVPNFALLLCVAFLPFSTAFLAKNLGQFVPALFYDISLLALALASIWIIHVATHEKARCPGADPRDVQLLHARGIAAVLGAMLAIAIAFLDPRFSQLGLAIIPLGRLFVHPAGRAAAIRPSPR